MQKYTVLAGALVLISLLACSPQPSTTDQVPAADANAPAAMPAATDTTPPAANDDGAVLGTLVAVDQHEIDAAKQAMSKNVSAPVMAYARMMETQHGDNLTKSQSLGTPTETPDVQAMKAKGQTELDAMGQKTGKPYETAYVDAMIKGHGDVLTMIDSRLMPMTLSEPVKAHLTDTRATVDAHLQAAKALKAKM